MLNLGTSVLVGGANCGSLSTLEFDDGGLEVELGGVVLDLRLLELVSYFCRLITKRSLLSFGGLVRCFDREVSFGAFGRKRSFGTIDGILYTWFLVGERSIGGSVTVALGFVVGFDTVLWFLIRIVILALVVVFIIAVVTAVRGVGRFL